MRFVEVEFEKAGFVVEPVHNWRSQVDDVVSSLMGAENFSKVSGEKVHPLSARIERNVRPLSLDVKQLIKVVAWSVYDVFGDGGDFLRSPVAPRGNKAWLSVGSERMSRRSAPMHLPQEDFHLLCEMFDGIEEESRTMRAIMGVLVVNKQHWVLEDDLKRLSGYLKVNPAFRGVMRLVGGDELRKFSYKTFVFSYRKANSVRGVEAAYKVEVVN